MQEQPLQTYIAEPKLNKQASLTSLASPSLIDKHDWPGSISSTDLIVGCMEHVHRIFRIAGGQAST